MRVRELNVTARLPRPCGALLEPQSTQRKNILSAFLFLAAFLGYVYSRGSEKGRRALYTLSLLSFIAGCLAKALVVVLPVEWCFILFAIHMIESNNDDFSF